MFMSNGRQRIYQALFGLMLQFIVNVSYATSQNLSPDEKTSSSVNNVEIKLEPVKYKIISRVPVASELGLPTDIALQLKSEMKKILRAERKIFLSNVRMIEEPLFIDGRQEYATLENNYSQYFLNSDIISIQLNFEVYLPRENPIHNTRVINFHVPSRTMIELKGLFAPEAFLSAISVISNYSRSQLNSRLQEVEMSRGISDWISEGTLPKSDNFQIFALTKDGLKIIYEEYQVACYALGVQEVLIPWGRLREFLQNTFLFLADDS